MKQDEQGFTLVELMVVLTVIALLLSIVVPDYVGRVKRAEESVLQENLMLMRDALDKHYADAGKYPTSLEELVAKRYLRSIPKDPFTQSGRDLDRRCRPPTRRRAGSSTFTAAPRAMSAGRRHGLHLPLAPLAVARRGDWPRRAGCIRTRRSARRSRSCSSSASSSATRSRIY